MGFQYFHSVPVLPRLVSIYQAHNMGDFCMLINLHKLNAFFLFSGCLKRESGKCPKTQTWRNCSCLWLKAFVLSLNRSVFRFNIDKTVIEIKCTLKHFSQNKICAHCQRFLKQYIDGISNILMGGTDIAVQCNTTAVHV